MSEELAAEVRDVLAADEGAFQTRAEEEADMVKSELRKGTFDNHQAIVGLEYEFYAVADGRWEASDEGGVYGLMRVPRRLLRLVGFEKELGLHNAEMCTTPQPFNPQGLTAQAAEVKSRLLAALDCAAAEGIRLVSDGIWTIPPAGETARGYLTDSIEVDDVRMATNMSNAVRYHAMANGPNAPEETRVDAPHVDLSASTVMPESLITSIQPHYQVAHAEDLPTYHNYALRVAGPLLALGVNSPFFPPDLYEDGASPDEVLADAWDEHRIRVFESVLNTPDARKVRFPEDLATVEEAVERVATDPTLVPMSAPRGDRFDDKFATLRMKHGTFWRWVRPVFDGVDEAAANARIEFRPIPAQPTVRDSIAFQVAFAGLMHSLPRRSHPVIGLDWETARSNFYAAMRDGLGGEQRWITHAGRETTDTEAVYEDLLAHAVDGLETAGFDEAEAEREIAPLRDRVERGRTPASWKRREVRLRLDDGDDLADAIHGMQRAYIAHQVDTLLDASFVEWADP